MIDIAELRRQADREPPFIRRMMTDLLDEIERLRAALINYGVHDEKCIAGQWNASEQRADGYYNRYGYGKDRVWCRSDAPPKCTCGFAAALAGAE